jgi:hypothetical protein
MRAAFQYSLKRHPFFRPLNPDIVNKVFIFIDPMVANQLFGFIQPIHSSLVSRLPGNQPSQPDEGKWLLILRSWHRYLPWTGNFPGPNNLKPDYF